MKDSQKSTKDATASDVKAIVSFTEWNNGDVEIDPSEWFTPIFAKKVIVSTGEILQSGRVVGYKGNKTGIMLGAWAGNVME